MLTIFPQYIYEYPNMYSEFPFHLAIHHLKRGVGAHRHDFVEVSLVIEGEGIERINGVTHRVKPGTFTLVLPYQIHEIYPDEHKELRLYNCMFGMNILFDTNTDMGLRDILLEAETQRSPYMHFEGKERERLNDIFATMLREYKEKRLWRNSLLRSKIVEALIYFDRERRQEMLPSNRSLLPSRPRHIWNVVHYVHQHYREPLTLQQLAEVFHMSPSHLSVQFKKSVGISFLRFLHELRIRHACGLLKSTEMSIAEIAMEVGYGSFKTFSRVFREHKGMTPSEYRAGPIAKQAE